MITELAGPKSKGNIFTTLPQQCFPLVCKRLGASVHLTKPRLRMQQNLVLRLLFMEKEEKYINAHSQAMLGTCQYLLHKHIPYTDLKHIEQRRVRF